MAIFWNIGQNLSGRDFVVGDVHGHWQQLQNQLAELAFNPACDRLFCLGDIVDRGPDSAAMVEMIDQKVYFSILGNHEAMMIAGFEDPEAVAMHAANGGEWFYRLSPAEQQTLVDKVRQWPWAAEIQAPRGTAGLVHADVPDSDWNTVKQLLRDIGSAWAGGAPFSESDISAAAQPLLWNRGLIRQLYRDIVGLQIGKRDIADLKRVFLEREARMERLGQHSLSPFQVGGIDAVFMGHSYVPFATNVGNCHFLDIYRGEPGEKLGILCLNEALAS
ncbi:metallophosphoesterase [Microbulbifer sp. SA54]|uniref:metallophosphoesterase n=1 Tax=Microbulbifer sp. SA54 TaxID=3401577 RepID=UPI003AAEE541